MEVLGESQHHLSIYGKILDGGSSLPFLFYPLLGCGVESTPLFPEERASLREITIKFFRPILIEIFKKDPQKDLISAFKDLITMVVAIECVTRYFRTLGLNIEDERTEVVMKTIRELPSSFIKKWKEIYEYRLSLISSTVSVFISIVDGLLKLL